MANAEQLSRTVEQLYAAAADPTKWRDALVAIETFTGSTGAVVDMAPFAPGADPVTISGSFSREDCELYAAQYQAICPRIRFARDHPDIPIQYDQLILSEHQMDRDPTYAWLGSHGLRYYVGGVCGTTQRHLLYFSLQRTRAQGHADSDDIRNFELIRSHLAQALGVADLLGTISARRRFGEAVLDSLPQAALALDRGGSLLFANRAGEHLLAGADRLAVREGRLRSADPDDQPRLDMLVKSALDGGPGGVMRLRSRSCRRPCAIRVSPLDASTLALPFEPVVLVIVVDPYDAKLDEQLAAALYDLTPAEARTAAALVAGHSVESAAQSLSVSGETIRTHLKALFRKVGVSRQQDLVRMLVELEVMLTGAASSE